MSANTTDFVVDDDQSSRESVRSLVEPMGVDVQLFSLGIPVGPLENHIPHQAPLLQLKSGFGAATILSTASN